MAAMKEYGLLINGIEHTLQLSAEDAAEYRKNNTKEDFYEITSGEVSKKRWDAEQKAREADNKARTAANK